MKERIQQLLVEKSLTANKLAETMDVQPSGISHILSGRNKPSSDFIIKLLTAFPEINTDWFILGNGPMFRKGSAVSDVNNNSQVIQSVNNEDSPRMIKNVVLSGHEDTETDRITGQQEIAFDKDQNASGNISSYKQIAGQISLKRIRRVMVFFSDHTVESFDYSEEG